MTPEPLVPVNSIDNGNTGLRVRAGRSGPQTISTKLSEREISSDWRSFNPFFSDSASATERNCKPLETQSTTNDVLAEMRVGSIPTLDSVSKRYDTIELGVLSRIEIHDKPWPRTLATSVHLKSIKTGNATRQILHTWKSLFHQSPVAVPLNQQ